MVMAKRVFRLLVCLILVAALVVNVSPLKAHAFSVVPVLVPVAIVATAVLVGVGLSPGSDPSVHANIVDAAVDYLAEVGYVIGDGMIQVQKMIENGAVKFGIDMVIAKVLQDWVYAQGYVSSSAPALDFADSAFADAIALVASKPYFFFATDARDGSFICGWSNSPFAIGRNLFWIGADYGSWPTVSSSKTYYYTTSGEFETTYAIGPLENVSTHANGDPYADVSTSLDLTLGDVASQRQDFGSAYPTWTQSAFELTAEDGTATTYVVTGLGATAEETATMSQAEVQSGVSTYVDSTTDTESGTITGTGTVAETTWATFTDWLSTSITGIIDAVVALPTTITQAVADVFTPSQELDTYTMQLSDFFPFCIPFDLYALLSVFAADPVAPCWELEFDFGELGTFPFTVDLSQWDELAGWVRTFEVVLFCIGLAVGTKKLLGW